MPTVILSDRSCRNLSRFAESHLSRRATPLPGGFWAVPVDEAVLHAIQAQRGAGESNDAVIWRLMTAVFPLQRLPD